MNQCIVINYVFQISQIVAHGGRDAMDMVCRGIEVLICTALQRQFNRTGRKGTGKKPFNECFEGILKGILNSCC